jgi:general secretion pathway protein M
MKLPAILAQHWQGASRRERQMLLAALALVLGAFVWWVTLAPALATLRATDSQRRLLDAQLQQMQRLQAQAKTFQAQPRIAFDDARRLLEASMKPLGNTAQLVQVGERATVTFKGASADAVAQWLAQVRLNARSIPGEARLVRSAAGTWDGTLALNLGAPPAR